MNAYCPACLSPDTSPLWSARAHESAQAFVRVEASPERHAELTTHIRALWGGDNCTVHLCRQCGFGFAHPFMGGDARFYNLAYPGVPGYPDDKWEFRLTLSDLRKESADTATRPARCLEVGAGIGNFLKNLPKVGIPLDRVSALEFNDESRRVLAQRGIKAEATELQALVGTSFDRIFAFQVVEHMSDIDGVFAAFNRLLSERGSLYLAMPNPQRIEFNETHGSLLDMPPNHISRWTRQALEEIVRRHGLRVDRFEVEEGRLGAFLKEDLKYYTLRKSMVPGTLASAAYGPNRGLARKLALGAVASTYAVRRIPVWLGVGARYRSLGGSIWAKVSRAEAASVAARPSTSSA